MKTNGKKKEGWKEKGWQEKEEIVALQESPANSGAFFFSAIRPLVEVDKNLKN